jgi:hypothetical protein
MSKVIISFIKLLTKVIIWIIFYYGIYRLLKLTENDKIIYAGLVGVVVLILYCGFGTA